MKIEQLTSVLRSLLEAYHVTAQDDSLHGQQRTTHGAIKDSIRMLLLTEMRVQSNSITVRDVNVLIDIVMDYIPQLYPVHDTIEFILNCLAIVLQDEERSDYATIRYGMADDEYDEFFHLIYGLPML
jgi:hypothetical protein